MNTLLLREWHSIDEMRFTSYSLMRCSVSAFQIFHLKSGLSQGWLPVIIPSCSVAIDFLAKLELIHDKFAFFAKQLWRVASSNWRIIKAHRLLNCLIISTAFVLSELLSWLFRLFICIRIQDANLRHPHMIAFFFSCKLNAESFC